jgi:hypothetical protein
MNGQARSLLPGIVMAAGLAIALVGCGTHQDVAKVRETVRRYLSATTSTERCRLLSATYRTENPDVFLSGGCIESQHLLPAEEAARRMLHIEAIDVHDNHAAVALVSPPGTASSASSGTVSELTSLELQLERGQWRIDGVTATASGTSAAG